MQKFVQKCIQNTNYCVTIVKLLTIATDFGFDVNVYSVLPVQGRRTDTI